MEVGDGSSYIILHFLEKNPSEMSKVKKVHVVFCTAKFKYFTFKKLLPFITSFLQALVKYVNLRCPVPAFLDFGSQIFPV